MEEKAIKEFNSPEYKSRCIEWALALKDRFEYGEAAKIVDAAKKFYAYVYGDDK